MIYLNMLLAPVKRQQQIIYTKSVKYIRIFGEKTVKSVCDVIKNVNLF